MTSYERTSYCTVYIRTEKIFVVSQPKAPEGWLVHSEPVFKLAPDCNFEDLGSAIISALKASNYVKNSSNADSVLEDLGIKSWGQLDRDARCLSVSAEGNVVTVSPMKAVNGGYAGTVEQDAQCVLDARSIGAAVLERAAVCTVRGKGVKSKKLASASTENLDRRYWPVPFGYKCTWLAVRNLTSKVIKELKLKNAVEAEWSAGISAAYEDQIFVSPPVAGWVFVVGLIGHFPEPCEKDGAERHCRALCKLSARLGPVQYFGTHRVSSSHEWARAENGNISRLFADSDGVRFEKGTPTTEEVELGMTFEEGWYPSEEDVMQIAGKWSLNPQLIDDCDESDLMPWLGWIGEGIDLE